MERSLSPPTLIENTQTRLYYIQHCAQLLSRGDAQLGPHSAENFQRERKKPIPKSTSNNQPTPHLSVPSHSAKVTRLLWYLDEKTQKESLHTTLVIQTAATSMERAMCQKQWNKCVEQLQKFNFSTSPERCQYYEKALYHITQRIRELDQLRLRNFSDFIHLPPLFEGKRLAATPFFLWG